MLTDDVFEYNPEKSYETAYYESYTIVQTPYGKVYVTIRSDSSLAFEHVNNKIFPKNS